MADVLLKTEKLSRKFAQGNTGKYREYRIKRSRYRNLSG